MRKWFLSILAMILALSVSSGLELKVVPSNEGLLPRLSVPDSNTNRFYTLQRSDTLGSLRWSNVPGWEFVPGTGSELLMGGGAATDLSGRMAAFYRVMESATNPWAAMLIPHAKLQPVLDQTLTLYRAKSNDAPGAATKAIADYLATRPEFATSGYTVGCAWGRLTNGILVLFDNDSMGAAENRALTTTRPPRERTLAHELPGADLACLYSCVDWDDFHHEVESMLRAKNYRVRLRENISMDDLITLPRCGVFLLGTHSTDAFPSAEFALYTSTPDTPYNRLRYAGEMLTGKITIYHLMWGEDLLFHLAMTAKGAREWWNFEENSFVLIDSCRSFNAVSADLRAAVLAKGASVYGGWTLRSFANKAPPTEQYLFDRLLGVNAFEVETPPQRSFTWELLKRSMRNKNLGFSWDAKYIGESSLTFEAADPAFGVLAPSIHRVTPRLDKKLQIIGYFGQDPRPDGEVDVAGVRRPIESWQVLPAAGNLEAIICDLPDTGPGSMGDVRVTVRRHESNLVSLSEYRPQFIYTYTQGSLKVVVRFNPRWRADLHMSRSEPDVAPKPIEIAMIADSQSTCEYECSGSRSDGDIREEWSGKGTLKIPPGMDAMMANAIVDQNLGTMRIALVAQATDGLIRKITDLSSGITTTHPTAIQVGQDEWDGTDARVGKFISAVLGYNQASDQYLNLTSDTWISSKAARQYSSHWPPATATIQLTGACAPTHPPSKDGER